jgi:hypothetical protein
MEKATRCAEGSFATPPRCAQRGRRGGLRCSTKRRQHVQPHQLADSIAARTSLPWDKWSRSSSPRKSGLGRRVSWDSGCRARGTISSAGRRGGPERIGPMTWCWCAAAIMRARFVTRAALSANRRQVAQLMRCASTASSPTPVSSLSSRAEKHSLHRTQSTQQWSPSRSTRFPYAISFLSPRCGATRTAAKCYRVLERGSVVGGVLRGAFTVCPAW